jgi:hypothetical protein
MASSFGFARGLAGGRPVGAVLAGRAWAPGCRLLALLAVLVCAVLALGAGSALAVAVPEVVTGAGGEARVQSPTLYRATLNGTVNPLGVQLTDCHFDYVSEAGYEPFAPNPYAAGQSVPCVPAAGAIPADSEVHAVSAQVSGLSPSTTYHFRLQATTEGAAFGEDAVFVTPPPPAPPSLEGAAAVNLTGFSADLQVRVNPHELDTTYRFEWGTSTAYGTSVPVPEGNAGAGASAVPVSTHLAGLEADKPYHWRVVASNASGTTTGVDHVFVYETAAGGLPDGRAYEMVTPAQKNGALIGDVPEGPPPGIAEDGSRVVLGTVQCFNDAGSCMALRGLIGSPYLFSRSPGGWSASSLAPPAALSELNSWRRFSADAGTALFAMPTQPSGGDDLWVRRPEGSFVDVGPYVGVPTGPDFSALYAGGGFFATADFSHIVYKVGSGHLAQTSLIEYVGTGNAAPLLVGVSGGQGSTDEISACVTLPGSGRISQGVLSADGRTAYFTALACGSGTGANASTPVPVDEVFARVDNSEPDAHTVAISQPGALSPAAPNHECETSVCVEDTSSPGQFRSAQFMGASGDGSRVFFLSPQQLTDGASEDPSAGDTASGAGCSSAGASGCNLYEYDFSSPAGERLVDVSAGDLSGGGPRVQGVMAVAGDGSHVYFVARGVLTTVANGGGQVAQDGAENLYVFERDAAHPAGRVAFIAVLPEADYQQWTTPFLGVPANVTPDGRFLVFTSSGALTPDMTRTDGAQQVFRYDAQTGELVRISIGEHGFNDDGNGGVGNARIVFPSRTSFLQAGVARTDPTMSHDGAYVFFVSPVGLTPGALDSVPIANTEHGVQYAENVYEYHDGQVYLISDGRDTNTAPAAICLEVLSAVCLLGSDASGANVFFTTADSLVAGDGDTQLDVYDARICTAGEPCIRSSVTPAGCLGEGCHGVPAGAPSLPAAGSASFAGAGNLAPLVSKPVVGSRALSRAQKLARALRVCRSERRARRRVCEALARRRYGARAGSRVGRASGHGSMSGGGGR